MATEFYRRIVQPTREYPLQMVWLCRMDAHVPCIDRQRVAQDMLRSMHPAVMKFRFLFEADLQFCANTGRMAPDLWSLFACLFRLMWTTDSQEMEGVNSIIRKVVDLAPAIQLELLAARICIKKAILRAISSCPTEEPKIVRARVASQCVAAHDTKFTKSDPKRYAVLGIDEERSTKSAVGKDLRSIANITAAKVAKEIVCAGSVVHKLMEAGHVTKMLNAYTAFQFCQRPRGQGFVYCNSDALLSTLLP